MTEWGIYVELIETKCEGMIRMADMTDDFYEFDEKNYRIIGRKTSKVFRLGDRINVRIKKTDIDRRLIDLVFADGFKEEQDDLDFDRPVRSTRRNSRR